MRWEDDIDRDHVRAVFDGTSGQGRIAREGTAHLRFHHLAL